MELYNGEADYLKLVSQILNFAENKNDEYIIYENINQKFEFDLSTYTIPLFSSTFIPYKTIFSEILKTLKNFQTNSSLLLSKDCKFWSKLKTNLYEFKEKPQFIIQNEQLEFKIIINLSENLNFDAILNYTNIITVPRLISECAILMCVLSNTCNIKMLKLNVQLDKCYVNKSDLKILKRIVNAKINPFPCLRNKKFCDKLEDLNDDDFEIYGYVSYHNICSN